MNREAKEMWAIIALGTGKVLFLVSMTILMTDALQSPMWLARIADAIVRPALALMLLGFVLLIRYSK